jgi:hypothetical protein
MSSHWTNEFLLTMRRQADPPADAVIQEILQTQGFKETGKLFGLLIRKVELPLDELPPVAAKFIHSHSALPGWADPAKIRMAEQVFIDHGPEFLIFLYFKSLPTLYAHAKGAEVLHMTGRLGQPDADNFKKFSRRIAETGQFLMETMAPDALQSGGRGIQMALKIRLIHAAIRAFVQEKGWDSQKMGQPINQEELGITLMTFAISPLDALAKFGIRLSEARQEAYLHAWKVIGHTMGMTHEMLPDNVADGRDMLERILELEAAPSEAGKVLTEALVRFSEETIPKKIFDHSPRVLIRYLAGDKIADILEVQKKFSLTSFALPFAIRKFLGLSERLENLSLPLNALLDKLSEAAVRAFVGYFDHFKNAQRGVPEALVERWRSAGRNI